MSDSSLNFWDLPSISAPIMGCFFIVIMSPHQQFDRQFTIHKEVQILTKKQERRTTNLDDTPLYSHANLLSCPCYDNLYITFSFFCTATSFIHSLTDNGGETIGSVLSFLYSVLCSSPSSGTIISHFKASIRLMESLPFSQL